MVAHLCRLLEVELIETVDRQLDLQDRRGSRRPIGQVFPGAHQALMRVLVAAEPVLGRRTQRGQLDPALRRAHRQQVDRLEQRRPTLLQLADGAEGRSERHTHVNLPFGISRAEQSQRRPEPANRHRRSSWRSRRTRLEQQLDRRLVPLLGRLLDMVSALAGCGASRSQLGRSPRVRSKSPTAQSRLVDRPPHERMAKDEPARYCRRAHEITREQGIERGEPLGSGQLGDRCCQIGLERLAGHGRGLEQHALRDGE